jgi:hypothetical protein
MVHIKHISTEGELLAKQAQQLRKEAQGTPPGVERDKLVRRARQAETASRIIDWIGSKGLRADRRPPMQDYRVYLLGRTATLKVASICIAAVRLRPSSWPSNSPTVATWSCGNWIEESRRPGEPILIRTDLSITPVR